MNVLSGAPVSLDPNEIRVGTSMDQVLASQIGSRTHVPSLVLGIDFEIGSGFAVDAKRGVKRTVGIQSRCRKIGLRSLSLPSDQYDLSVRLYSHIPEVHVGGGQLATCTERCI